MHRLKVEYKKIIIYKIMHIQKDLKFKLMSDGAQICKSVKNNDKKSYLNRAILQQAPLAYKLCKYLIAAPPQNTS